MTITVHHLQVSQSERIVWLCEELGLDYKLVLHQRAPVFSPQAIKDLNPLGAAPILEDDSFGPKLTLAESGAIAEYLIHKHGNGRLYLPPSHPNYADFLYWWHLSNGNIQPVIGRVLTSSRIKAVDGADDAGVKATKERLDIMLRHVNDRLSKVPWLAGDEFTVADIMTLFSFSTMRTFIPIDLTGYDGLVTWMKRCSERPAYQRSREKGDADNGPYLTAETPELFPPLRGR